MQIRAPIFPLKLPDRELKMKSKAKSSRYWLEMRVLFFCQPASFISGFISPCFFPPSFFRLLFCWLMIVWDGNDSSLDQRMQRIQVEEKPEVHAWIDNFEIEFFYLVVCIFKLADSCVQSYFRWSYFRLRIDLNADRLNDRLTRRSDCVWILLLNYRMWVSIL